jgi:hypothetical protein
MGIRITTSEKVSALFDSVTGWAFGPTFETEDEAESFLNFTASGDDLRTLDDAELDKLHRAWLVKIGRLTA